jgi:carboxyl-terminal processing protease
MQIQGEILVDFVVRPDGTVTGAKVVRAADPRLAQLAEQAVSRWFFSPGIKNGVAVSTKMRVPIMFQGLAPRKGSVPGPGPDPRAAASQAHLSAGKADLVRKDYSSAASEFDAAVGFAPDSAAAYLGRAQAYSQMGREDEALDDFAQAASLDPADQGALDAYSKTLPDTPQRKWAALRYKTFNVVWRTVYETYFDPKFGGVDWLAVREKYRVRLAGIAENGQLLRLLQEMLGELRRTHFSIVPRKAAVFNPSERVRIGTTGAEVAFVEGGVAVTEVRPGSTGASAGMRSGDLVTRVDGIELSSTLAELGKAGLSESRSRLYVTQFVESRLGAAVGTKVKLELTAPGAGAAPRQVTVACGANDAQWSEPIGYFPSMPIRCDARRDPDGVAYLRFNIFVPPVMKRIRALLRELKPGDGLIVDLRGNGGGISTMASGICGWLCRDEFVLGAMHQRQGLAELEVYPQTGIFDGPLAILIDGQSASTSEILAAGLKERRRARLFGELTAGAALPSVFKSLPTGDLFQFAVADVTTPSGALLEGNGVAPNEVVLRTRADLEAGRDPVADAARRWIDAQRRKAQPGRAALGG